MVMFNSFLYVYQRVVPQKFVASTVDSVEDSLGSGTSWNCASEIAQACFETFICSIR